MNLPTVVLRRTASRATLGDACTTRRRLPERLVRIASDRQRHERQRTFPSKAEDLGGCEAHVAGQASRPCSAYGGKL